MSDTNRMRAREILHRTDGEITEAEYVFDETQVNGTMKRQSVRIKKQVYHQVTSAAKRSRYPFESFIKIARPLLMGQQAEKDIPEAFRLLDADHSDSIEIGELALFMPAIIPDSNQYMLLRYFQPADINNDYRLSLEEFTDFIKKGVIRDLALGRR